MHGHGRVAEERFGPGGGDDDVALARFERVADVVEGALFVGVVDFEVGQSGAAADAPVDHPLAAVDEALVVEVLEGGADGPAWSRVEREREAVPIARGAEAADLVVDDVAVLVDPLPDAVEERLAPEVVPGDPFEGQRSLHHHLRGDARVVLPGKPERLVTPHAVVASQRVFDRGPLGVSQVQLAGDVRRRHDDRERTLIGVGRRLEEAGRLPPLVETLFDRRRLVGFGERVAGRGVGHRRSLVGDERPFYWPRPTRSTNAERPTAWRILFRHTLVPALVPAHCYSGNNLCVWWPWLRLRQRFLGSGTSLCFGSLR